ncbi:MAG TPA: hypothetical protein VIQ81_13640 [Gammaproteobacteria bacterium]
MTIEEFRNLAQGIQAVFVALAAIIASGWAVYTFRSLLSVQKAKIELTKIEKEVEKSSIELRKIQNELKSNPLLNIIMDASSIGDIENNSFGLLVKLRLKNIGNTHEIIDWQETWVKASLVSGVQDERLNKSSPISGLIGRIYNVESGHLLLPTEEHCEEFFIPIREHGIYLIESNIFVSEKTEIIYKAIDANLEEGLVSFGTTMFYECSESGT